MQQSYNPQLIEELATDFPRRKDTALDLGLMDGLYANLYGIRCYWNFARRSEVGATPDIVRGMTLTQSAAITSWPYPHISASYHVGATTHYRVSEAALNITGGETFINAGLRGMTVGCWVNPSAVSAGIRNYVAKRDTVGNLQFYLRGNAAALEFAISNTGAAWVGPVIHPTALVTGTWQFVCGRFYPSQLIEINLNGVWNTAATAVATIFAGDAPITIAGYRTVAGVNQELYRGYIANPFYVAARLPDYHVEMIRQWTKPLFGV